MKKQLKIFGILNILDLILTYIALEHSSNLNLRELNPFYYYLFPIIGILGSLLFIKIIVFTIFTVMVNYFYNKRKDMINKTMIMINIAFVFIVINNIYQNIR